MEKAAGKKHENASYYPPRALTARRRAGRSRTPFAPRMRAPRRASAVARRALRDEVLVDDAGACSTPVGLLLLAAFAGALSATQVFPARGGAVPDSARIHAPLIAVPPSFSAAPASPLPLPAEPAHPNSSAPSLPAVLPLPPPAVQPLPAATPPPPQSRLAVVIQGPVYAPALRGFLNASAVRPIFPGESPALLILSTTDSHAGSPYLKQYADAGFHVLITNESAIVTPRGTFPGSFKNSNFQRATTMAGVDFAATRGATHVLKMRGDTVITDPAVFREHFGLPSVLRPLWWYGPQDMYLGRPFPPSPSDTLFLGPLEHVRDMFDGRQDGIEYDTRLPEINLFDGYLMRRNMTRLEGCFAMPPLGVDMPDGMCLYEWRGVTPAVDCNHQRRSPPKCQAACDSLTCPPYVDHVGFPTSADFAPLLSGQDAMHEEAPGGALALQPTPAAPAPAPPVPAARDVRWAVVVQGLLFPQGAASWGDAALAAAGVPAERGLLRVLSVWTSDAAGPLFDAYIAGGFVPVRCDAAAFGAASFGVGAGNHNVNMQKHTSFMGLLAAQARGATHALKTRADIRVTDARAFLDNVLVPGALDRLSFLIKWVGSPRYPVDYLVAGPIEMMLDYFGPPYAEPSDGRFPELFLMQEYSRKRGWTAEDGPTHIKFCREVDFFFPRLPPGLL